MRVRVELGPRDAAAGQCVLATHEGPPGHPAAKRVVAAGPALAAAARTALGLGLGLGLPAEHGEAEGDDEAGDVGSIGCSVAAGRGMGGGANSEGLTGAGGLPEQGDPGRLRAGAGVRSRGDLSAVQAGGSGTGKKRKKERERDMQAPAASADAGLKPGRAAAEPAAGRVPQAAGARAGGDAPGGPLGTVGGTGRKDRLTFEGSAAGAAPSLARAGRRKAQVSGDDLGDEFAIEEDAGAAGQVKKKKRQCVLDAPQAAGQALQPTARKAAKLVKF